MSVCVCDVSYMAEISEGFSDLKSHRLSVSPQLEPAGGASAGRVTRPILFVREHLIRI